MKKLLSNKNKLTSIMITTIGIILAIVSIIYLVQSYSYYSDEWGTDISFSEDSVVLLLCSVVLIIYGIYSIDASNKGISTSNAYHVSFGLIFAVVAFYSLGMFFKGIAKNELYTDIQDYLYIGIIGLVILIYIIISFKQKKSD